MEIFIFICTNKSSILMVLVANGPWPKHVSPARVNELAIEKVCPENDRMTARAVLICRPNSHPFQERTLTLDQPVKIGRSVARARPAPNNAIFDCKVLSRNHALLWYENGKFYLQDTKSSNGTFVNNQRLSKGSEESPPREVCSADIVQFGVDVMENSRKVTHGCIVATLKLYLPDGKEAKASPSTSVVSLVGMVPLEDLYQLNQYLQEALQREQLLENKLATLQRLVGSMRQASDEGWKALIDEDRLLSRVEILENQLQTYSKTFAEDKLREELRKLQDDKEQYQGAAKEAVRKVLQEKLDAVQKLQDLERALGNSEDECNLLRDLCEKSQIDCKDLAHKYKLQQQRVEELSSKLQENEDNQTEMHERLEQEKRDLQRRLEEQLEGERNLQVRLEALQMDGDITQRQLNAVEVHLRELQTNNSHSKINESKEIIETEDLIGLKKLDEETPENLKDALQLSQEEIESLKHRLDVCEEEQQGGLARIELLNQQLEESQMQQELKNNAANHLHERIRILEAQLQEMLTNRIAELDSDVFESNKDLEFETHIALRETTNKMKAELLELGELLLEARANKRDAEEQVLRLKDELKAACSLNDKAASETNVLRQQLQQISYGDGGNKYPMLQLEQQMVSLVSSTQNMQTQMSQLQKKLQDEHQRNKRQVDEIENLRKQVIESQQYAKQSHNEAEKLKDTVRNLQKDLDSKRIQSGSVVQEDNRRQEELSRYRQECESLQSWISVMENEMRTLKSDHSKLEEENKSLRVIKADYESMKSKLHDVSSASIVNSEVDESGENKSEPSTSSHDIIQLKQLYVSCQQRKAELAKDLENLKQENKKLSNQSNAALLCGALPLIILIWAFITRLYTTLSFITGTSD
ncbi:hypothetical protein B566_EDAN005067 [Ephemera danica]|nr:hypothetical protein B566_EDAN005067 [Ephemera danica]